MIIYKLCKVFLGLNKTSGGNMNNTPFNESYYEVDKNLYTGIGKRVAELLVENEYTQSMLATELQVSPAEVSSWINGKRNIPVAKKLSISELFQTPVSELEDYECHVPIKGEVQDDWSIIDYDALSAPKSLRMKNIMLPSDTVGWVFQPSQELWWRNNAIWIARVVPGRFVDQKVTHPKSDGNLSIVKILGGGKYLCVPQKVAVKNTEDDHYEELWNLNALGNGVTIKGNVELEWSIPILIAMPNWNILQRSFYSTLD